MRTVRLIGVMCACIGGGMAAGYKLSLVNQYNRLERNKALVRLTHERVWSERDNAAAAKAAREFYTKDFVAHTSAGDSTGGVEGYIQELDVQSRQLPRLVGKSSVGSRRRRLGRGAIPLHRDAGPRHIGGSTLHAFNSQPATAREHN